MTNKEKPIIIKRPFPGEAVERHLRTFGHLPTTKLCDEVGSCIREYICKDNEHEIGCPCKLKKSKGTILIRKRLSYKKAVANFQFKKEPIYKEIEIIIGKYKYVITEANYKHRKDVVEEFKQFVANYLFKK